MLKNSINESIDPCENFYQFACGNFIKTTEIPLNKPSISPLLNKMKTIFEQLETSLQEKLSQNDTKTFKKLKKYYKMCKDEGVISKLF